MKLCIFAVYDQKAGAYLPPFFLPEVAMAIRTFGDCINDEKHQWGLHPEDYTLFHLGDWNNVSAEFSTILKTKSLGVGTEYIMEIEKQMQPRLQGVE